MPKVGPDEDRPMTIDEIQKLPPGVRDVALRVLGQTARQYQFVQDFRCPLESPKEPPALGDVPCHVTDEMQPIIQGPVQETPCPQWEKIGCFRRRDWAAWSERAEEREWLELGAKIGIPRKFAHVSFATSEATDAVRAARSFLEQDVPKGRCLRMLGPNGVGKTWASVALLRALRGKRRAFLHYPAFSTAMFDHNRRAMALDLAKKHDVVVFDDFGSEYSPAGNKGSVPLSFVPMLTASFDEILWHRHENELVTVLTSRLLPDAFDERITDNVKSRLESAWCVTAELPGEDLRQ